MQFKKQKSLKEIFESMDDYDLCQIVNRNSSQYTNDAFEIALAEYEKRKIKKPKIDIISSKNRKKQIEKFEILRIDESKDFFYRHILWRMIGGIVIIVLFFLYT